MRPSVPDLLLATPDREPDFLIDVVTAALRDAPVGRLGVQLRQRLLGGRSLLPLAERLREITRVAGAALLVNGRIDVAIVVGADGVHLPERGVDPSEARRLLGADRWVGVSRHATVGVLAAAEAGADYATFGPLGSVPGKGPAVSMDELAAAVAAGIPVLALGGVEVGGLRPLVEAGVHGVAVMRAVFDASDPGAVSRALLGELDAARAS